MIVINIFNFALTKLTFSTCKARAVAAHCSLPSLTYCMAFATLQMHMREDSTVVYIC